MADSLTSYLRLRISDALTPAARYNLQKIDDAFSRMTVSLDADTVLRATTDILIEPESADIGGSGSGGSVSVGTASHILDNIYLYGPLSGITSISVSGAITGASLAVTGAVTAATVTTTGAITAGGSLIGTDLQIKDTAGSAYLSLRYQSTLSGGVDPTNRVLTYDTTGGNRTVILGGNLLFADDFSTSGSSLVLTTTAPTNVTLPTSGTLATRAGAETLTNKTMSGASNTFSNIPYTALLLSGAIQNSDLAGGISATKIGAGSVDNTTFGYLAGVTSAIQTQIDSKAGRALNNLTVAGLLAGDLLYATSSTVVGRVGIGAAGQVLTSSGTAPFWAPAAGGTGGAGIPRVTYIDLTATTLPTGTAYSPDGTPVVNGDLVLFTALLAGNSRAYVVAGVGVALSWTAFAAFEGSITPTAGQQVVASAGTALGGGVAIGQFSGTQWNFNRTVRHFEGADYWEENGPFTTTLADNTTGNVFTVAPTGSENWVIKFSVVRGATREVGSLYLVTDGTTATVAESGVELSTTVGVSFSADISGGLLRLRFTTTSTGTAATFRWHTERWSSSAGGPASVPNYSVAAGSVPAAGTVSGAVQLRGSTGYLDADDTFLYDTTENALSLGGSLYHKRQTATLLDNQAVAVDAFTFADTYRYIRIEYGLSRGTDRQVGRLLLTHDGATVFISDDALSSAPSVGVVFSATVAAGTVHVKYTTTSTGSSASMSYNLVRFN